MYVLGIADGHTATACLLKDGVIVACASEERFTRIKNQAGFPVEATKWILEFAGITAQDLDAVCFHSLSTIPIYLEKDTSNSASLLRWLYKIAYYPRNLWGMIESNVPSTRPLGEFGWSLGYSLISRASNRNRMQYASYVLGIPLERIYCAEHHLTHALAAYWGNRFHPINTLVITLDGEGDGLCSTVSVSGNGFTKLKRIAETSLHDSLGYLYMAVTQYLGMKPNEHEYKVMGLAPYCSEYTLKKTYPIFAKIISLESKGELRFHTTMRGRLFKQYLRRVLEGHRFDGIAGAIQRSTEELTCELIRRAIKQTGIKRIALGGGVFMNVKANMAIMNLPEVDNLFVFPSCGDESCAIGAAYYGYLLLCHNEEGNANNIKPLESLYLGPEYNNIDIESFIKDNNLEKLYLIEESNCIEEQIADLLAKGKIVARLNGRMEWGARSLGNRSILANPSDQGIVRILNEQIKSRDFWMPFAPSILKEREMDYIVNPKRISAPYMILAFPSTELAQKELRAAMHPFDMSLRPQIVEKRHNPSYYRLLKEFEARTGIGGLLNTSFNLHGEPIVCSPQDALHVFENSGLEYMAIGNFLISKK